MTRSARIDDTLQVQIIGLAMIWSVKMWSTEEKMFTKWSDDQLSETYYAAQVIEQTKAEQPIFHPIVPVSKEL